MLMKFEEMTPVFYVPSDRVSWCAVPATIVAGLAAMACGWLGAWANVGLPFGFSVIALVLFCACLSLLVRWTCRAGKVRNERWLGRAAVVVGLAGWYGQWVAWSLLVREALIGDYLVVRRWPEYVYLASHPWDILMSALPLANAAEARLDSHRFSGLWMLPLWGLELVVVLLWCRHCACVESRAPFCEKSGAWAKDIVVPHRFAPLDNSKTVSAMIPTNPAAIAALFQPAPPASGHHAEVTIHRCRAGDSYLSIVNWSVRIEDGKQKRAMSTLIDRVQLCGVDVDALLASLERRAQHPVAQPDEADRHRITPPELFCALARLEARDHAQALSLAKTHVDSDKPGLRADANRLCALAAGGLGRWLDARAYWLALFADEPGAHAALQVATSAVMAGDSVQGAMWFDSAALFNDESHELPWGLMLTSFLTALSRQGDHPTALPYVEELRDAYAGWETTDSHCAYMAGLPVLADFLSHSLPIVQAALPQQDWLGWYEYMRDDIDDNGRQELDAWLAGRLAPAA